MKRLDYGDVAFRLPDEIEINPYKYIYVFNCGYVNIHDNRTFCKEGYAAAYLLLYLHKGTLKARINDKQVCVKAGNVLIFKPKQLREITFEPCEENERYFIYFQGTGVNDYLEQLALNDKIVFNTGDISFLIPVFKEVIEDYKIHDFDCDVYRTAKLLNILTGVSACLKQKNGDESGAIYDAVKLIEQTYYCNYPLSYYANKAAQSIPSFIRNFKKTMGVTPKKYLNDIKIEKAKMFLATTDLSVGTVALNVGMCDSFYFCNFFKKNTGVSPTAYRNLKKE